MRISDWSSDVCSSDLVKSLLAVVDRDDPEQILQPAVKQRVSLHVEKHVALAWARQPRQAAARFGIQQFDHPFARLALVGLKTRLMAIGRASCRERGCQYG